MTPDEKKNLTYEIAYVLHDYLTENPNLYTDKFETREMRDILLEAAQISWELVFKKYEH